MPYIVHHGNKTSDLDLSTTNFDYDYPNGLDLKPGSELHNKIKNKIFDMATEAAGPISNRFDSWRQIDRILTSYVDLSDKEKVVKSGDSRKPVSVVFPYSYAIMESLLGYLMGAFFQEPIFRYEGVSPEDTIGGILLEKVIDLQCNKSKVALNLHTMFRDSLSYGFGTCAASWQRKWGTRTVKAETGFMSRISGLFKSTGFERDVEEVMVFEGNKLFNVDPYLTLPDPNVSIHNVQDGEFFGWVERTNYTRLLKEEENDNNVFNVKYLKAVHNKKTSIYGEDKSERNLKAGGGASARYNEGGVAGTTTRSSTRSTTPVDVVRMYAEIIPKEWKLGTSEYPEKWFFSLAADDVIIEARPLDLDHDLYPVGVSAPDFDGYSVTPISRLERLYGLQEIVDWMLNTHVANVRKAVNDMFIYDPYLINSNDMKNPGPGKLIRMRRPAWGRGVKDAVMQFPVNDVTRQHVADSAFIVQWMQKIGAADEQSVMGASRQGGPERLTKGEFDGTSRAAFSKLQGIASIIGLQAMQDLGLIFASHTQQLMEQETYIKASGRWQETLLAEYGFESLQKARGKMKVSPYDLLVNYDVKVRDGSIPGGNFSGVWMQMFEAFGKYPELGQNFDLVRIFKHIARNSGAKNVEEFVKIKVVPDDQIEQEVDRGNIATLDEAGL